MEKLFHSVTGLEHDERGFPNYDPRIHKKMTEKRFNKMELLAKRWPVSRPVGPEGDLDVGIISWGSSSGAALEAVRILEERGIRAGGFLPRLLWPVVEKPLREFIDRCAEVVVVEMNSMGQYANIVEQVTHRDIIRVCDVFARPVPVSDIVEAATREDK
jgi:2-oxoglutarate ferredoxin oxidoreductase subunit alpha